MIWFLVGAVLGVLTLAISLIRRPMPSEHPVEGFAAVAVMGAAVYGTVLWLLFG